MQMNGKWDANIVYDKGQAHSFIYWKRKQQYESNYALNCCGIKNKVVFSKEIMKSKLLTSTWISFLHLLVTKHIKKKKKIFYVKQFFFNFV